MFLACVTGILLELERVILKCNVMQGKEGGTCTKSLLPYRGVLGVFLSRPHMVLLTEDKFVERYLGRVESRQTSSTTLRGVALTTLWRDQVSLRFI